jgi:hypothetical protein
METDMRNFVTTVVCTAVVTAIVAIWGTAAVIGYGEKPAVTMSDTPLD